MVLAGALAGVLSSSLLVLFGGVNLRGVILGAFLALGVVIVEKRSSGCLSQGLNPELPWVMMIAAVMGILAGISGYHATWIKPDPDGFIQDQYFFSYLQFIGIFTLYSMVMIPAYFSKWKILNTVVAGTLVSAFVETLYSLPIKLKYLPNHVVGLFFMSLLFKGGLFALLWADFVSFAGRRKKITLTESEGQEQSRGN
jgi:hypothetical protein